MISSIASNVISPAFNANVGYDGLRDFTHIAYLGGPPAVQIVHPSLGARTYAEFLKIARESKEPLSYISPGTGSNGFLVGEYLARQEGYKVSHIPYKGAGPALTDLIAGHVKLGTITFSTAAEQIRAGSVLPDRGLDREADPEFSRHSDLKELGQDLVAATWFAISGPGQAAERGRAGGQPRDVEGDADIGRAEAARTGCDRDQADVARGIHEVHRGRDRSLGAAGKGTFGDGDKQ